MLFAATQLLSWLEPYVRPGTSPHLVRGSELSHFLQGGYTKPAPCSLDVIIERWTTLDGERIRFPFVLAPSEVVVGETWVTYKGGVRLEKDKIEQEGILAVESKSKLARVGFVAVGFKTDSGVSSFLWRPSYLDIIFQNTSDNSLLIEKPFAAAQLAVTVYDEKNGEQIPARLINGKDEDVTEKNKINFAGMNAYMVHLAGDLVYMKKVREPISITRENFKETFEKKLFVRVPATKEGLEEMVCNGASFFLGFTEETVATNGCPVYMFPFHYIDGVSNQKMMQTLKGIEDLYVSLFEKGMKKAMRITGNAGIVHNGTRGIVVTENSLEVIEPEQYIQRGKPFGIVVPIPLHGGGFDETTYEGTHGFQRDIFI